MTTAALILGELDVRRDAAPRGLLRATFLDVGQGDSAVVDLPDGQAMVIDGGGLVGSPVDTGTRVLAPELRARRRDRVAIAILSHPHPDHYTGLPTGLAVVAIGQVWDTGRGERLGLGGAYEAFVRGARARRVPILHPDVLCGPHAVGGALVEVLAPCPGPSPDRRENDNSLVVRLTFGVRRLLFVGDAEAEEEAELLATRPGSLRADVLKVGHHGSRTSTGPAFLDAVDPSVAVVSTGVRNRYGHPDAGTLATLERKDVRTFRTDRDGAVRVETDGVLLRAGCLSPSAAPSREGVAGPPAVDERARAP